MDPFYHPWEQMDAEEVARLHGTSFDHGLTSLQVQERLTKYGKNVLEKTKHSDLLENVARQFKNPIVFILLAALVVTTFLHEYIDAFAISAALIINVVIGTLLEERASRAFEKLRTSQEHRAIALRDGNKVDIASEDLVPGDLIYLESGYYVPADARIVEEHDLSVNESVLSGEWLGVPKHVEPLHNDTTLTERNNMVWMGTLVESGFGRAIVVATGKRTQLGEIAEGLLEDDRTLTPLQKNIRSVAQFLTVAVALALVVVFVLGVLRGNSYEEMFLLAIAVAVATVPSGLPAALTVVLALGMEAILKRGGLVRSLLAAETLGATTIILTDKTGTLTEAKMKLAGLYTLGSKVDEHFLLELAVLEADAFIEEGQDAPEKLTVHGRPIEKAIVIAGLEAGLFQSALFKEWQRIDAIRFESERRFGATLLEHIHNKQKQLVLTGAPEALLEQATYGYKDEKHERLTDDMRAAYLATFTEMAKKGKRGIGLSYKHVEWSSIHKREETHDVPLTDKTTFVGLIFFEDPVREDVYGAIQEVQGAGASVIMLTGDTEETARAVALEVGITHDASQPVMLGAELDGLSDNELYAKVRSAKVIARALPSHKLRIARVLKNYGEVVAMTGDGINDAPALREASIGVAVGSGTEVAKEAADIVLINNSFSIITAAIEEGRRITDNVKKIVTYLLSTSFSEISLLAASLIAGVPLPLVPVQILWANIIEEGLMSFSFAFEEKDPNSMKRNPRTDTSKNIMTKELRKLIIIVSMVTGAFLVALYFWLLAHGLPIEEVRTVMFASLTLDSIFFAFSLKSLDTPLWRINIFNNRFLLIALLTSVALLLLALFFPPLSHLLSLVPLSAFELLLLVSIGVFNLITIELAKYVFFERPAKTQ